MFATASSALCVLALYSSTSALLSAGVSIVARLKQKVVRSQKSDSQREQLAPRSEHAQQQQLKLTTTGTSLARKSTIVNNAALGELLMCEAFFAKWLG